MTCPICGAKTKVVDTQSPDCETIKRKRECLNCYYRFFTVETESEQKVGNQGRPKKYKRSE